MAHVQFLGNLRSAPVWAKDFGGREHVMAFGIKLDAAAFPDGAGVPVTLTANAAQGATSITVTALNFAPSTIASTTLLSQSRPVIPAGTVLDFGGAKFARTTADAAYGATSVSVAALPTALVSGDKATYAKYGGKFVPSGTLVGRTYAEAASNAAFGPADTATPDDEIYLLLFDVPDLRENNDGEAYRPGSQVAINYLPGFSAFGPNDLAQLRARYQCFNGAD